MNLEKDTKNKKILEIKRQEILLLFQSKKISEAKDKAKKHIENYPKDFVVYNILGAALSEENYLDEAIENFKKSIELDLKYAEAYNNLGTALQKLYKFDEAILNYKKAIELKPNFVVAYNNLAMVLKEQKKKSEAIDILKKTIKINSEYFEAHYNLGVLLKENGELIDSIKNFKKTIEIKPDYYRAYSNYLFNLNYLHNTDVSFYIKEAKIFGKYVKKIKKNLISSYNYLKEIKKIKVGLVSGDFCNHPIGYFLDDTLKNLRSSSIELFAYSNSSFTDSYTNKLKFNFANWTDISKKDDVEVVNKIREDGIHILIDLSGHTAKNRLPIFVNKPAPMQATWAGYLASTGIPEIDFIIADPYVAPYENKSQFAEKIIHMPNIWGSLSRPDFKIKKNIITPAEDNGFITFGCFNSFYKLNDHLIKIWSKVLNHIPKSKIILKNEMFSKDVFKSKILEKFKSNSVNTNKIILEKNSPRKELLEHYNKIDVALDPFPYSGGTSSFEAAWMGVPIYVLKGNSFVSKCGESINSNLSMEHWICEDSENYVSKIFDLTSDYKKLSQTRKKLVLESSQSVLFDSSLFAKNFEDLLWKIWKSS